MSRISCCILPSSMSGFLYNFCRWLLLQRSYCIGLLFVLWVLLPGMVVGLTQRGGCYCIGALGTPNCPGRISSDSEGLRGRGCFSSFVFYKDPQFRWSKFTLWETSFRGYHTVCFHHEMDLKQQESTRFLWPHSMIILMLPQSIKLTFFSPSGKALKTKLKSFTPDKVKYILLLIFIKIVISISVFTILLLRVKYFLIMHP